MKMVKRNSGKQTNKAHHKNTHSCKKQGNGYHNFCAEQHLQRADLNSMSAKERTKVLRAEWRQLSAHQKQTYKTKGTHTTHQHGSDHKKHSNSGRNARSGIKRSTQRKRASPKKTNAKKTKRLNHKSATRKANHPQEHQHHHEMHENGEHIHE